jgi:TonB family protein
MDFLNTVINSPVFNSLSMTLIHFVWQGTVLALFLGAALKLISNKYSNLRYNLSILTLILCLIAPCITYFLVYNTQLTPSSALVESTNIIPKLELSFISYLPLLSIVWLMGVSYLSIGYCKALLSIYKLPKTQVSEPEQWLNELFISIKQSLYVSQNVRLLVSKLVEVPMVIGWLKPVILVPVNMVSGLSNEQLKLLIAHELAHVKRYDYFINLIQSLVEVFLFYHPAVKWISKQIRIDREYCCDDIAVKNQNVKIDYAKALLNAEELRPNTIPLMAMAATGGDLKSRVSRVVGEHTCTPKYAKSGLAGLLGLFVVSLIFSSYKVVALVQSKEVNEITSLHNISLLKVEQGQVDKKMPSQNLAKAKKTNEIQNQQPDISVATKNQEIKYQDNIIKNNEPSKDTLLDLNLKKDEVATKLNKLNIKTNQQVIEDLMIEVDDGRNIKGYSSNINALKKDIIEDIQNLTYDSIDDNINVVIPEKQEIKGYEPLVIPPKTLKMVNPIYTESAQRRGYKGDVVIEFTVDLTGKATDIEFVGETKRHLKRAVRKAIKKWEFSPGTVNGNEAVMRETKLFSFVKPNREKMTITTGSRIIKH